METLILVGAGFVNTKCAAVLLYNSLKQKSATIEEVTKKNVTDRLKEVKKGKYNKIFLIGTSIKDEEIIVVAKKLKENGTEIVRFSAYDVESEYKKNIEKYIELVFKDLDIEGDPNSFFIVKEYIKKNEDDYNYDETVFIKIKKIYELGEYKKESKGNSTEKQYLNMLEAASSLVRRFKNMKAYEKIIKSIGNFTINDKIIEEYTKYGSREIVGKSKKTKKLKETIKTIAKDKNCSVMIYGETGTGKETIAYQIHAQTENRKENKFVAFNCADLTPSLIENKLFGYIKGAFTGAEKDTNGLLKEANKGTLFLDEIAELSLELQAGLLRVLQEQRFYPVGSITEKEIDIRVIGATNKNIFKLMEEGKFRKDLYFRLATVEVNSISLKENKQDIGLIASRYAYNTGFINGSTYNLSDEQIKTLSNYDWPGNVRQLQNIID